MINKKTKIVATLGPASNSQETIMKMIGEGLDVCRINFSHGSHEVHAKTIENIRKADDALGTHTAILADLQGPKLRVGSFDGEGMVLKDGDEILFSTSENGSDRIYITYPQFPEDVKVGERILLDDGKLILEATATNNKDEVKAKVIHGGL